MLTLIQNHYRRHRVEGDNHSKVYVLFIEPAKWWHHAVLSPILKAKQGYSTTYVHTLICCSDSLSQTVTFYEVGKDEAPTVSIQSYSDLQYDNTYHTLTFTHDETQLAYEFSALDMTDVVSSYSIALLWELLIAIDETPLTWLSSLYHMINCDFLARRLSWTCSGLTASLLGLSIDEHYWSPKTPDELFLMCTLLKLQRG